MHLFHLVNPTVCMHCVLQEEGAHPFREDGHAALCPVFGGRMLSKRIIRLALRARLL